MHVGRLESPRPAGDGHPPPAVHRHDHRHPVLAGALRIFEVFVWLGVGLAGVLMLTQAFGWHGTRLIATTQALTPYIITGLVPITVVAHLKRRHPLAFVAGLAGAGGLVLALPLVFPAGQPPASAGATEIRVASVNLYYRNPTVARTAAALADVDADVIVFSEYTAEHQADLLAQPLADQFAYRVERDGFNAGGVAVWSRFPLTDGERPETINYSLDLVVAGPDGDVRLLAVHPPTPVYNFGGWRRDLALIGDIASDTTMPTMIVGDMNASYWHPSFRDLLDRGFTDAHTALGRGFATSWPTDRWFPPFVQLDHALTDDGLVATDVENFRIPGSDHEGFVVSVAPTR